MADPSLTEVGAAFEKARIFLRQLIDQTQELNTVSQKQELSAHATGIVQSLKLFVQSILVFRDQLVNRRINVKKFDILLEATRNKVVSVVQCAKKKLENGENGTALENDIKELKSTLSEMLSECRKHRDHALTVTPVQGPMAPPIQVNRHEGGLVMSKQPDQKANIHRVAVPAQKKKEEDPRIAEERRRKELDEEISVAAKSLIQDIQAYMLYVSDAKLQGTTGPVFSSKGKLLLTRLKGLDVACSSGNRFPKQLDVLKFQISLIISKSHEYLFQGKSEGTLRSEVTTAIDVLNVIRGDQSPVTVEKKPAAKRWGEIARTPQHEKIPDTYEEMAKKGLFYTDSGEKVPHDAGGVKIQSKEGTGLMKSSSNPKQSSSVYVQQKPVEKSQADREFEEIEKMLDGQKIKSVEEWKKDSAKSAKKIN